VMPQLPVRSRYASYECTRLLPNSNPMNSKLTKMFLHHCWCCNRNQDMVELGLPWPNEMLDGRSKLLPICFNKRGVGGCPLTLPMVFNKNTISTL
jgi:hypothetical protein